MSLNEQQRPYRDEEEGFAVLEQLFQKLSTTASSPSSYSSAAAAAAAAASRPAPDDETTQSSVIAASSPSPAAPYIILIQHSLARSIRLTRAGIMESSSATSTTTRMEPSSFNNKSGGTERIAASSTTTTTDLYRRAGLSTPAETAARDWVAGTLWLEQFIRIYSQREQQQQQDPITHQTPTTTTTTTTAAAKSRLIWIQTTPLSSQPLPLLLGKGGGPSSDDHVTIINASLDPWGWDSDGDKTASDDDASPCRRRRRRRRRPLANLDSLQSILAAVQFEMDNNSHSEPTSDAASAAATPCMMVAFDSLTSLLTRHGFARILRFLQSLSRISSSSSSNRSSSNCCRMILLLPILTESLSRQQHLQLEDDLAQAVLWLHHGHAIFLKRGVRESDNFMRHDLPFDIISVTQRRHAQQRQARSVTGDRGDRGCNVNASRLVLVPGLTTKQQEGQEEDKKSTLGNGTGILASDPQRVAAPAVEPGGGKSHQQQQQQQGRGGRAHVQLQLEQEDAPRQAASAAAAAVQPAQRQQQPLIYLENDDPEFDDYDEEDPDDDLDI